jgi:sec-independent protein translocase protein TatA
MKPGLLQILLILLLIALIFGYKKIPDIARALGRSSGEFKKGLRESNEAAAAKVEEVRDDMAKEALRKEIEDAEAALKEAREKMAQIEQK